MRKIHSNNLSQLLLQLKYTPQDKRRAQLAETEKLLDMLENSKDYPFSFIFYRITTHKLKEGQVGETVTGGELRDDLLIFIQKLSGQIPEQASEQREKVYNVDELAEKYGVSVKTISRWRKYGLSARQYIYENGHKRLGFMESAVEHFFAEHKQLSEKAGSYSRMTRKEKNQIIKRAIQLGKKKNSRNKIIEIIRQETGRGKETVRYVLDDYEKENAEQSKVTAAHFTSEDQAHEIFKLYSQGVKVAAMSKRFGKNRGTIYRLINIRRAQRLHSKRIEYVMSEEFLQDNAQEMILDNSAEITDVKAIELKGTSLQEYLKSIRDIPMMVRDEEVGLFRQYNYLKYLACIQRAGIKIGATPSSVLKGIEKMLSTAERIKKKLIESNLRLIVNIARKHTKEEGLLLELISEGNYSLTKAVEKFDYSKGFRFGTFASWVVTKDFARKLGSEILSSESSRSDELEGVDYDRRIGQQGVDFKAIDQARKGLAEVIGNELDEREQYIILNHFALTGDSIKKKKKTLKQIGKKLDLTSERVRQLELQALQKLRHRLSSEVFEFLTGS